MTTQSKHTPGPWKAHRQFNSDYIRIEVLGIGKRENKTIAQALASNSDLEANARLIAAAPDLLKACEVAKEFLNSFSSSQIISAETDTFDFDKTCGLLIETLAKAKEGRVL